MPDEADPPTDTYGQTKRVLEISLAALAEAGAGARDVIRTRTHLTADADYLEAPRAHGEVFGDIRPASTMVIVSRLLDPRWLVEMEAGAIVG